MHSFARRFSYNLMIIYYNLQNSGKCRHSPQSHVSNSAMVTQTHKCRLSRTVPFKWFSLKKYTQFHVLLQVRIGHLGHLSCIHCKRTLAVVSHGWLYDWQACLMNGTPAPVTIFVAPPSCLPAAHLGNFRSAWPSAPWCWTLCLRSLHHYFPISSPPVSSTAHTFFLLLDNGSVSGQQREMELELIRSPDSAHQ